MKTLVLGCGQHHAKLPDHVLVDVLPFLNVDKVHDLNITPWPFKDGEFTHVSACHLVEHLISLVAFMDEAWRVLEPGGSVYITTPEAGGDPDLEFADPTHIRCYRRHSFINYFTREGIAQFGYTQKPWAILELRVEHSVIIFHATPLK